MILTIGTFDSISIDLSERVESIEFSVTDEGTLNHTEFRLRDYKDTYEVDWEKILSEAKKTGRISHYRLDFRQHIRDVHIWHTGVYKLTQLIPGKL